MTSIDSARASWRGWRPSLHAGQHLRQRQRLRDAIVDGPIGLALVRRRTVKVLPPPRTNPIFLPNGGWIRMDNGFGVLTPFSAILTSHTPSWCHMCDGDTIAVALEASAHNITPVF